MAVESTFLLALVGMALASFACRISGFLLMGYVRITPRVEAALKAVPTLRKGMVEPERDATELRKQFDSLPPGQKLKAALAMQQK